MEIGNEQIDAGEIRRMCLNSNDFGSRGQSRRNARRRVLEDDATRDGDAQQGGRAKVNVGCWFGIRNLVSIDNDLEHWPQSRTIEDEVDIGWLGVRGHCHGNTVTGCEEARDPRHEMPLYFSSHHLAIQLLL